jgi:IstB-like ATP binding protein
LLVLDELGYLPCDSRSADLLYNIVSRRHERKSTVITTNLAFKQWSTVFPGAACVGALVDRFAQHCHTMDIDADSWRQKPAPPGGSAPKAQPKKTKAWISYRTSGSADPRRFFRGRFLRKLAAGYIYPAPRLLVAQTVNVCVHIRRDKKHPAGRSLTGLDRVVGTDPNGRWLLEPLETSGQ